MLSRRRFPAAVAGLALGAPALAAAGGAEPAADESFAFPVLGDLHFDRLAHHDMDWLRRDHPGDVSQVENYSRISREVLPRLLEEVRGLAARSPAQPPFVIQLGDLVEGLCGSAALARTQCEEAVAAIAASRLGAPWLFTKGNHDITGPGGADAFDRVLRPFLAAQAGREPEGASFSVERGPAQLAFLDAYDRGGLDWLERVAAKRSARHLFVVVHPPVVPFGARSLWHLFANERQHDQRRRLLDLLGAHRAIVLCGHLHKYGVVVRRTATGRFLQLGLSSIIARPDAPAPKVIEGVARYGPDLVTLEPRFSPADEPRRREALRAEVPSIAHYEYADGAGHALVEVGPERVHATVYNGLGRTPWRSLDLTAMLDAADGRAPA